MFDDISIFEYEMVAYSFAAWHPDKLKLERHRFHGVTDLIRQKGLVPEGTAKYVGGQQPLL